MSRCGIRTMCRVRDEHRAPGRCGRAVACVEKSTNDHNACHLAVCSSSWLQGDAGQASDFGQVLLKLKDNLERALRITFLCQRMKVGKTRNASHSLVQTGVVLHRA